MRYEPYEYQRYAAEFILGHPRCAVFLECGMGKSVITLTAIRELLKKEEIRRVLIIAPLRVAQNTWPAEIEKWDHLDRLTYAVACGKEEQRRKAVEADARITVINRENTEWLFSNFRMRWDMVVLDELSSFKSHTSKRFKALKRVIPKAARVVGLTGTPGSNGLMDLWAEFFLIDGGMRLGRHITGYRLNYFSPDKTNGQVVYSYRVLPGAEERIYSKISDITVSMRAGDFLKLPELVVNDVYVRMDGEETAVYRRMKEEMAVRLVEGGEISAANAAVLCGRLSQMASGTAYAEDGGTYVLHDRKLDALEDLAEGMNGKPMLVAYWFRCDLERIRTRFPGARQIRSGADIADWNAGRISMGLIHPGSAGHGLNLQEGGSTLVWYTLPWSLELYGQTNARLFRQGQKNTVVIHRILTKGTVDERIAAVLAKKGKVQDALIDAVKAELGR